MTELRATDLSAGLPGAVHLADLGLIQVQGPDATSFLQGQLTQDIAALGTSEAKLAGYCSAKGRLLASFIVWRIDAETVFMACSADLLAATVKRLSMFVMRAKVKLSDASGELSLHGIVGDLHRMPASPWQVGRSGTESIVRLPDVDGVKRALRCAPLASPPDLGPIEADVWNWLDVRSAIPRITAVTAEQFVPQMVNLEALDGVNFRKGCYPGQEIVARSQYRGTIKRRAFLFDSIGAAHAGQEVFNADDPSQPAGMVIGAASLQGRHAVLAEVKLAALEAGSLHVGAVEGPVLQRADLPYTLPTEAA